MTCPALYPHKVFKFSLLRELAWCLPPDWALPYNPSPQFLVFGPQQPPPPFGIAVDGEDYQWRTLQNSAPDLELWKALLPSLGTAILHPSPGVPPAPVAHNRPWPPDSSLDLCTFKVFGKFCVQPTPRTMVREATSPPWELDGLPASWLRDGKTPLPRLLSLP